MADNLLLHHLQQQADSLESLYALLQEELNVIASRNGDALRTITPQKRDMLRQIQEQDRAIKPLLLNQADHDSDVEALIGKVQEILEACKKQNDVNAQAAHQAQLSIKQIKEILIGAPSSVTYDQAGGVINSNEKLVRNLKA